jgi:hypothetical protein
VGVGSGPVPPSRQAAAPVTSSFDRFASCAADCEHCERCVRCAGAAGTTCGRQRDADESTPKYRTSGCRGGGIRLASRARNCATEQATTAKEDAPAIKAAA